MKHVGKSRVSKPCILLLISSHSSRFMIYVVVDMIFNVSLCSSTLSFRFFHLCNFKYLFDRVDHATDHYSLISEQLAWFILLQMPGSIIGITYSSLVVALKLQQPIDGVNPEPATVIIVLMTKKIVSSLSHESMSTS